MNKSIRKRLFYIISGIIVGVILLYYLLNTLMLEKYYIKNKKEELIDVYKTINSLITVDADFKNETIKLELEKLTENKNINIDIIDASGKNIYNSSMSMHINMGIRGIVNDEQGLPENNIRINTSVFTENLKTRQINERQPFDNYTFKRSLESNQKYSIELYGANRFGTDFIILSAKLDSGMTLITRSSVETISESVKISNEFLILVGIFSIVIGGAISYIISKQVTKPIEDLSEISNRMAALDFSVKYNAKSEDEIGGLGNNINKLSETLEKTIQDLKNTNLELEKDIEKKSKIDEMRKQFLSDVSHELKTPIALIQGYAEGLSENVATDEESKKYYCNVIIDETNKMDKLVKQLLTLSKIEYGNEEPKRQEFNITELVNDIVRKSSVILENRAIRISVNTKKQHYVFADEFMIEQVVTNYLNNAIKNVDEKKIIKINIKESNDKKKVIVSVYNTGEQIPEEQHMKIWTRFYKVDESRNREGGGTGIGLALVKAILNKHNNKYGVKNVEDGAEFFFELDKV